MFARRMILGAAISLVAAPVAAQEFDLARFQGIFAGNGFVRDSAPNHPPFEATRAHQVVFQVIGEGFVISWTSIPDARSQRVARPVSQMIRFRPSDRVGLFIADTAGQYWEGAPRFWAAIEGDRLTVYASEVDSSGRQQLSIWKRTLTSKGLDLEFTSAKDGSRFRTVAAHLQRIGPAPTSPIPSGQP